MPPQAPIHACCVENQQPGRNADQKIGENDLLIGAYPSNVLETHRKRDENSEYAGNSISEEEVPVANSFRNQNLLVRVL